MDKVPVKISERYKPPPKISIPHHIYQRLNSLDELFDSKCVVYDFSLERNVLLSIQEWKKMRNSEKENRRERMRRYEINRLREIEEKQKQLLTAVSYPSTDDLSSDEEQQQKPMTEIEMDVKTQTTEFKSVVEAGAAATTTNNQVQSSKTPFSPTRHQNFNTILTPTVVPDTFITNKQQNNTHSKINYSDFENDTSSPFDNIELKTINDLDILAQVLNISSNQNKHSNSTTGTATNKDSPNENKNEPHTHAEGNETILTTISPTAESHSNICANNVDGNDRNQNKDNFQYKNLGNNIEGDAGVYFNNPSYQIYSSVCEQTLPVSTATAVSAPVASNNYNTTTTNINDTVVSTRNISFYNNFYNNLPTNNQSNYNNYLYNTTNNYSPIEIKGYSNNHNQLFTDSGNNVFQNVNLNAYQNFLCTTTPNRSTFQQYSNIKSGSGNNSYSNYNANNSNTNKSKSVPDILKELNDEISDSEMRRRNDRRRYYQYNHYQDTQTFENSAIQMPTIRSSSSDSEISDTFMKLSPSSQVLAKNISLMGFPLERVSKIAEKFGNDDKKIVEHLIPLSELLDLGFDESKISEALIKFNNNKEKALDFLIS